MPEFYGPLRWGLGFGSFRVLGLRGLALRVLGLGRFRASGFRGLGFQALGLRV